MTHVFTSPNQSRTGNRKQYRLFALTLDLLPEETLSPEAEVKKNSEPETNGYALITGFNLNDYGKENLLI